LIDGLLSLLSDVTSTFDALDVPWILAGSLVAIVVRIESSGVPYRVIASDFETTPRH
jgi:hypothetical protein